MLFEKIKKIYFSERKGFIRGEKFIFKMMEKTTLLIIAAKKHHIEIV